ncbi:hypothetical protein Leryth_004110 [Lithospermum erythrorhizon]|nr:hypothetical protein Leryth_004110 [Lithospermum erythrorhizon]
MEKESLVLEITLISAQGLKPPLTNMGKFQTYAVLWVDSSEKLRTRIDSVGSENPTWNDKFLFKVNANFITKETSGVCVDLFAVGHFRDSLVGSVRFLLGNCLVNDNEGGFVKSTPVFNAVLIQRPSGKFEGVLNVAISIFDDSVDFQLMNGLNAVCFRDLMGGERRRRRLSRIGSRRSEKSSGGSSCEFDLGSVDLSDGTDSTTSSSSAQSGIMKEWNGGRCWKSDGGGLLCGLLLQKRIQFCPSDQNLRRWAESTDEI